MLAIVSILSVVEAQSPPSPTIDRSSVLSTAKAFIATSHVTVRVISQSEPYAVVSYQSTENDANDNGQVLLQRFAFGWQVIDAAPTPPGLTSAQLYNHGISPALARALLQGIVPGKLASGESSDADYGSTADVNAVREAETAMQREAIPTVKIYDGYAMLQWFTRGAGGESVFVKRNGHWVAITGGGGCLNEPGLEHYGVSSKAAARFSQWFPCGPPVTPAATR